MYLDTKRLNLIAHAAGRAILEISLSDGLISKTALVQALENLAEGAAEKNQKSLFNEAAEIVKNGSCTHIVFTDQINMWGEHNEH